MAVILRQPTAEPNAPEPKPGSDVTPTKGLSPSNVEKAGDVVKVSGSSGNDVITLTDLAKDSDQVIKTGAGNDVFRWNGDEGARAGNTTKDINGIVKFGNDGPNDNDQVFLANQLSDYEFTLRSDGGIKIHYIGTTDGAAVTFYSAESFTFRNISDSGPDKGTNYATFTLTYDDLVSQIKAASAPPETAKDVFFGV